MNEKSLVTSHRYIDNKAYSSKKYLEYQGTVPCVHLCSKLDLVVRYVGCRISWSTVHIEIRFLKTKNT